MCHLGCGSRDPGCGVEGGLSAFGSGPSWALGTKPASPDTRALGTCANPRAGPGLALPSTRPAPSQRREELSEMGVQGHGGVLQVP